MGTTSDAARGNTNRHRPNHAPDVIDRARALWDEGKTASEVAWFLGITREAVCAIARRNDFPARPPSGRFTVR
jgi:hypothetical protein